ncbi:MAG: sensor domain-containing diguanylate cyclase [Planctomycetales bacterium]|nr:sensor domain-containing diguanylate cyclase [Planctomycetales bacterium]
MWKLVSRINPWMYGGLLLGSGPVTWHVSREYGWPAAWSSLLVIVLLTTLNALRGPLSAIGFAAAVGAITASGAVAVAQPVVSGTWTVVLSVATFLTVVGLSFFIHARKVEAEFEVAELQDKLTDRLRALYELQRQATEVVSSINSGSATLLNDSDRMNRTSGGSSSSGEMINYPMLLLSLQDMARSIASNLDMDSLVETVVRTAANLLKCTDCQVYVWNAATRTLTPASVTAAPDAPTKHVARPDHGVTQWVIANRQIITREDLEKDYALRALLDDEPNPPDALIPLAVGGELLGLVVLHGMPANSQQVARLLPIFATVCALGVKNAQLFQRIEEMARRDGLTGLWNRATFNESLDRLTQQARDQQHPLCVVMSDVDHFKKFNDSFGHQAGDHVLREVARLWKAALPDSTVVARYGGEEFIAILPNTNVARARELAESLREELQAYPLDFDGQELHVTASFGIAELNRPAADATELVRLADEAMYAAKKSGRNRVCAHGSNGTLITAQT